MQWTNNLATSPEVTQVYPIKSDLLCCGDDVQYSIRGLCLLVENRMQCIASSFNAMQATTNGRVQYETGIARLHAAVYVNSDQNEMDASDTSTIGVRYDPAEPDK